MMIRKFADNVPDFGQRGLSKILLIDPNERGQGTGAKAVHRFKRKLSVGCGLAGLYLQLPYEGEEHISPTLQVTRCAETDMDRMFAAGFEGQRFIEGRDFKAVDLRHAEAHADMFDSLFWKITVLFLYVLKNSEHVSLVSPVLENDFVQLILV